MSGDPQGRRFRPWLGAVVIGLLLVGMVGVAGGAVWAIEHVLPHREPTP